MATKPLNSVLRHGFFHFCRTFSISAMTALTAVRHVNVPPADLLDGCVVACNHQSYLDPVLVGMAFDRPLNYLARSGLFELPGFAGLIRALGAHPVRQGTADSRALRTIIGLLRRDEPVLLFPEGTRTWDGGVGDFQPGIAALSARCNAPVLPVCIEGAFRSWPRSQPIPLPARIGVMYGEIMEPPGEEKEKFMNELRRKISRMQQELKITLT